MLVDRDRAGAERCLKTFATRLVTGTHLDAARFAVFWAQPPDPGALHPEADLFAAIADFASRHPDQSVIAICVDVDRLLRRSLDDTLVSLRRCRRQLARRQPVVIFGSVDESTWLGARDRSEGSTLKVVHTPAVPAV